MVASVRMFARTWLWLIGCSVATAGCFRSTGPETVTVYPVTCEGTVYPASNGCRGRIAGISERLEYRVNFPTQTVWGHQTDSGFIFRLYGDCTVFDAESWYCFEDGGMHRMDHGIFSRMPSANETPADQRIYVGRWRWWYERVKGWVRHPLKP